MKTRLQFIDGYAKGTLTKEELEILNQFPAVKEAAKNAMKPIDEKPKDKPKRGGKK